MTIHIILYLEISILGGAKFASKLNSKMNTPESCSFWVTDTGNISFSTQIHCFHQVLASWLSSISLLELKIFLLTTPPCHTSKVASWHVDCRYELHFWSYLGKILSKSPKTGEIWHYCSNQCDQHYSMTKEALLMEPIWGLFKIFMEQLWGLQAQKV